MRGTTARTVGVALALVLASVRQSAGDPIIHEPGFTVNLFADDPLLGGVGGLAVGSDGLYCSTAGGYTPGKGGSIAKVSWPGSIQQVAAGPAYTPSGIAVDRDGVVLVGNASGYGGNELYEVWPTGQVNQLYSGLSHPTDIRLDSSGNILVVEREGPNSIRGVSRIARDGSWRSVVVRASDYGWPGAATGIELDSQGVIYVAYRDDGSIYAVPSVGTPYKYARVPSSTSEIHLAFGSDGSLFASNDQRGEIYKISPSGNWSLFASGIGRPMGMAFDSAGTLYLGAQSEGRIYSIGVVPEPFSLAFMGSTFVGVVGWRARRRVRAVKGLHAVRGTE